jgi:hypothetical protein
MVMLRGDSRGFKGLSSVWVTIENHARDAVFTALVKNVRPVIRAEDGFKPDSYEVPDIPWENSTAAELMIRWGKSARLKLALGSESWQLFWFWSVESPTYTEHADGWRDHYGVGWRLKPLAETIEFDLHVIDTTHKHREIRPCLIRIGERSRIEEFSFQEAINS